MWQLVKIASFKEREAESKLLFLILSILSQKKLLGKAMLCALKKGNAEG